MNSHEVYLSRFFNDSRYMRNWRVDWDAPGWRDIRERRLPPDSTLPLPFHSGDRWESFANLPPAVQGAGGLMVRSELAQVFSRFNLGGGKVLPAQLFKYDRVTPVVSDYHDVVLSFIDRKVAFIADQSPRAIPAHREPDPPTRWWLLDPKNGDISVSAEALDGTDIWIDPSFPNAIFLSGPLTEAIVDAGFRRVFKPVRCRVIQKS